MENKQCSKPPTRYILGPPKYHGAVKACAVRVWTITAGILAWSVPPPPPLSH